MHLVIHASRYKVRTVCSEAGKSGGLPRGREGSRGGNPGSVRCRADVRSAGKKKVYAAQSDCRKSGTRIFTRDYRQQATCQGQEKNGQPERMDRLVAQVPQTPERQRDAHARYGRYATDADQQEIVVHNNYQDACPSAYLSGSCGVWRYKKRGTKL